MSRRPRQSSQARIEHILSAARQLLSEGGLEALSIYAVAEQAGIPPSSLYHFFPSVPALLQGLTVDIHEAFRRCLNQPIDHSTLHSWHDLARIIERRTLAVYAADPAARQLILSAHGLAEVTQADQQHDLELGRLLEQLFNRHFPLPALPKHFNVFSLALELSDRVYARSVQQQGQISPLWAEEGQRVFEAYLALYLPCALPKRLDPLQ